MILKKIIKGLRNPKKILLYLLIKTAKLWPDSLFLCLRFKYEMGYKLDLKHPRTFGEKLQWLKLYNRKPEYTTMVDKYTVKDFVANKIGAEYIIPTIGVWDKPEDIDWDALPNQFVLKTTHGGGGGGVVVCKDKSSLDKQDAISKLSRSLNSDIYWNYREWPYKNVSKRIIAEQYMVDSSGIELKDYKFFSFNGRVEFFKIDFDRFIDHKANYYDREKNLLPFGEAAFPPSSSKQLEMPQNLDQMIILAEQLSKDLPFLRVDFYNINTKIFFGELTFFPSSGMTRFEPEEWNYKLGMYLKLPEKNQL